ncbi:MAG: exo-alpha-sialidase [Bacteroidetes bacterium]|nr:exo-alpha-sialidase [Bacteroidota bacterium]
MQTDTDLDGITDTINTTDGSHNMILEDDGTLHIFSPLYRIYSDLGAFSWIVNWNTMGIWHWKTGMAAAEIIDTELDWVDADCTGDPYTGIGASTFNYRNAANVTNPAASYDPITDRLFLLYAMKIEYTDIFDDPLNLSAQSFHDIFGCYSTDGGATWTPGVNLTNTAESGEENFLSM